MGNTQEGFAVPNYRDNALLGMIAESGRNQSFTIIEPTGESEAVRSEYIRCYSCDLVGAEYEPTLEHHEENEQTSSADTHEETL